MKRFAIAILILSLLTRSLYADKNLFVSGDADSSAYSGNRFLEVPKVLGQNSGKFFNMDNLGESKPPEDYIYILSHNIVNPNRPPTNSLKAANNLSFRSESNKRDLNSFFDPETSIYPDEFDSSYHERIIDGTFPANPSMKNNLPNHMRPICPKPFIIDVHEIIDVLFQCKKSSTSFDRWSMKRKQKFDDLYNKMRKFAFYYNAFSKMEDIKKKKKNLLKKVVEVLERKLLGKLKL